MARSMLLDTKLPKKFLAEAISTAVYLKNQSPTKLTLNEALHGTKTKVDHLRVFGSDAYAHIPKDERSKFYSKSRNCILYSRDVEFNECVKDRQKVSSDSETEDYQWVAEFTTDSDDQEDQGTQPAEPTVVEEQSDSSPPLRRSTHERRQSDYYAREQVNFCEVPL